MKSYNAINPVFLHLPFDPGRIPRGGAKCFRARVECLQEAPSGPSGDTPGGRVCGPGALQGAGRRLLPFGRCEHRGLLRFTKIH